MIVSTIEEVVKNGLCTGCGTCISLCPLTAIKLYKDEVRGIYIPKVDTVKCKQCGLCYQVCPGENVNFPELNKAIFNKESMPGELIGNYLQCYTGYSTDYNIRYNSTSGGLITSILIYALKEHLIDGALVTRMKKDNPLEPEPFIARTREEIIEAAKSKYCPVPANIALREIVSSKGKFAVVGLPCHIHSIRKAELINESLREKIVLHLGLFCSKTPTFKGIEYFLWKNKLQKEDIVNISFRGNGWPGGLTINTRDGKSLFFPFFEMWGSVSLFSQKRCTLCYDQSAEMADMSFGDAWLPELSSDKSGISVIVVRNNLSVNIINKMISENYVNLNEISSSIVNRSQKNFTFKKNVKARFLFLRLLGNKVPAYHTDLPKPQIGFILKTPLTYLNLYIVRKRGLWKYLATYFRLLSLTRSLISRH